MEPVMKIDVGSQLKLNPPSFQLPNMTIVGSGGNHNKRPRDAKIANKAL